MLHKWQFRNGEDVFRCRQLSFVYWFLFSWAVLFSISSLSFPNIFSVCKKNGSDLNNRRRNNLTVKHHLAAFSLVSILNAQCSILFFCHQLLCFCNLTLSCIKIVRRHFCACWNCLGCLFRSNLGADRCVCEEVEIGCKVHVTVPFDDLLRKVAAVAGCKEPEIVYPAKPGERCSINIVEEISGTCIFKICLDHPHGDSVQLACRFAILGLIDRYRVRVRDVNLGRLQSYEICSRLFRSKCKRALAHHGGTTVVPNFPCVDSVNEYSREVSISFTDVLAALSAQLGLAVGRIDVHCVTEGQFVAWMSLPRSQPNERREWVVSNHFSSCDAAREDAARLAIFVLELIYDFDVDDISYYLLPTAYEDCYNQMEACYNAEGHPLPQYNNGDSSEEH